MDQSQIPFHDKIKIFQSKFDSPKTPRKLDCYTGVRAEDPVPKSSKLVLSFDDKIIDRNTNIGTNLKKYASFRKTTKTSGYPPSFSAGSPQEEKLIKMDDVSGNFEQKSVQQSEIEEMPLMTVSETIRKFESNIANSPKIQQEEKKKESPKPKLRKNPNAATNQKSTKFVFPPDNAMNTIEEVSETEESQSDQRTFKIFDAFEKLQSYIDSQMAEIAKTKPRQSLNTSEDDFYDVIRGLALNREKFIQQASMSSNTLVPTEKLTPPGLATPIKKITPPEKGSPKDPLERISMLANGKRESSEECFYDKKSDNTQDKSTPNSTQTSSNNERSSNFPSDENESSSTPPITPRKMRIVKVYRNVLRLEEEVEKQQKFLAKLNRILNYLLESDYENTADIVLGERHYLVAEIRIQSCLAEIKKLGNSGGFIKHKSPYERMGEIVIEGLQLQIKAAYFNRAMTGDNDYLMCVFRHRESVIATAPIQILDEIRTIRFPEKFIFRNIFLDYEIRLEIYGTANWKDRHAFRETALKQYAFLSLTCDDVGKKTFKLIETVRGDVNPLQNKIRMKIENRITVNSSYAGILMVYCKKTWQKSWTVLNGHIFKLWIGRNGPDKRAESVVFDLRNCDNDIVVPVDHYEAPFAFRIDFSQYVEENEFSLLLAAEDAKSYIQWITKINQSIVLLKCK